MMSGLAQEVGRADGTESSGAVLFDIPPQSLETALDVYSALTNVQVLYETSLTLGRRSARVQGAFTREAALNALLVGTGLTAWHTTADSYSLLPQRTITSRADQDVGHSPPEITKYRHFLGVVQAGFLDALCRRPETRPGQYRIALKFRIGPSGGIQQTTLINSTGNRERDAGIIAAVEHLAIGEAPPLELSQPITMVIAPRSPDVTGDCAAVGKMGVNR